jgi:hypothetical protein
MSFEVSGGVSVQSNSSSNVGTSIVPGISISGANFTLEDQWVGISNNGTSNVSLAGWKLINMMKAKTYPFPRGFSISPGTPIRVHSGQGNDNSTDLYKSKLAVDKTDTVILKDASGKIISTYPNPMARSD